MRKLDMELIEVKKKMLDKRLINIDLQEALGKSQPYITGRMKGRECFSMDEIYILCELLDIPLNEISKYFPPSEKIRKGA
ncbi:helix-turn-helix domain-containing protein [Acetivibrio sp. MSJd-27]|uniref:helix-turn-helix domain-containing protein n=1 Tax=Acetivibrio sp. MSJd-27 TaxID=2841523 RepID=UPI001C1173DA|nr:helix-turn-helix domain-containing protein [Acetivibrio sp. MSJd-27]MBU5451405.1 helix-turn-helix domain-containing protein [Acetivibrio sp. MSJd-27]